MKIYWKNVKNTGKVDEKILEKCKKNWKSQGNSSVQKSGNHGLAIVLMFWLTIKGMLWLPKVKFLKAPFKSTFLFENEKLKISLII